MIRALAMVVMLHHVWLSFGNSLYARVISTNTYRQSEMFRGIANSKDGSALSAGPVAGPRKRPC